MNTAVAPRAAAVSSSPASPPRPALRPVRPQATEPPGAPPLRSGGLPPLVPPSLQPPASVLSFGSPVFDRALPNGLAAGAHEMAGEGAFAFSLMLLARALAARPQVRGLLIQTGDAAREAGLAYGPGLQALGLDPDRLGFAWVRSGAEALRVVDEALRSGAVAGVAADLHHEPRLDLSVTRRFNLSGRAARAAAFLAVRDLCATSAAITRWRAEPAPSRGPRLPRARLLGRPVLDLSLLRNRLGPTGEWILEWDSDDRVFHPAPPLSAPVAEPAVDRPDPARAPRPAEPAGPRRQAG